MVFTWLFVAANILHEFDNALALNLTTQIPEILVGLIKAMTAAPNRRSDARAADFLDRLK
jgi:hypothetical protein